jgi:hypothetical protein
MTSDNRRPPIDGRFQVPASEPPVNPTGKEWELAGEPAVPPVAAEQAPGDRPPRGQGLSEGPDGPAKKDDFSTRSELSVGLRRRRTEQSAGERPVEELPAAGDGEAGRVIAAIFEEMTGELEKASAKAAGHLRLLRDGQIDDTQKDAIDQAAGLVSDLDQLHGQAADIAFRARQGVEPTPAKVAKVSEGLDRVKKAASPSLWEMIADAIQAAMKLAAAALIALASLELKEISFGIPGFVTITLGPRTGRSDAPDGEDPAP